MADHRPTTACLSATVLHISLKMGLALLVASLTTASGVANTASASELTGEQIYRQKCASCHGPEGEGVQDIYPNPLAGDRFTPELTKLIAETMPQDDPGRCVGKEAEKVAAYIYDAFYSPIAQARRKPPRIELSRMTVRQYRNALADLLGSWEQRGSQGRRRSPEPGPSDAQGLRGEYFKSRRFSNSDRVLDRVDSQVSFDFGEASPAADKLDAHQFSIRWAGSVRAPETGEYEFIVNTEHATRLYVNDNQRPLIDAWVKSGSDTEYRGSLFLLGGRSYPLRLEFSKAKQGVDDSKKQKKPPPAVKASIALKWKPPLRQDEVISSRYLSPTEARPVFVLATPFPPDDRSVGYERGSSISKAWDQATTDSALETAAYVAARLGRFAGDRSDDANDREKVREFCLAFAERAFRRPLSDTERMLFVDRQFAGAPDAESAVKRVVLLVLKSPRFLYLPPGDGRDPYDVASRLSFVMWDSIPDVPLLEAAAKGELNDVAQIARQAERMATNPRAAAKLQAFFTQWLKVDQLTDLAKDADAFPGFDERIASDLRASLDWFVEDAVTSDNADYRRLLLGDQIYMNGRLAKFYGAELSDDAPMQLVKFEPEARAGVLSHPFLLAGFAYSSTSSPIHRGVFISRSLLGRALRPPPEAVSPLAPDLHADLSTRERVALQTGHATCQSCHAMINPLGFTLEHFDAMGRYRERENAKPINAAGSYLTQSGDVAQFTGARQLAEFLTKSPEAHAALAEQLFQALVKQPVLAYGPETPARLQTSLVKNDFNLRKLMVEIAMIAAAPEPQPAMASAPTAEQSP